MFKKLSILSVLFTLAVGFSACSSDDDASSNGIVGKWLCTDYKFFEENGKLVEEGDGGQCYIFKNDGTAYYLSSKDDEPDSEPDYKYTFVNNILRMVDLEGHGDGGQSPSIGGGHDEDGHIIEIYQIEWLDNNKFKAIYVLFDGWYSVEIFERL